MYTVEVNMPNLDKDVPVEIDGLGVFKNGSSTEVTDADAQYFRQKHSHMDTEYDENGSMTHTVVLGPTLSQAFRKHKHIKVTKVGGKPDPDDDQSTDGDHAGVLNQDQLPLDDTPEGSDK